MLSHHWSGLKRSLSYVEMPLLGIGGSQAGHHPVSRAHLVSSVVVVLGLSV